MRAAGQVEYTVSQLLRFHPDRRNGRSLDGLGNGDRIATGICLDVADGDVERVVAAIPDAEEPLRPFFMIPVRVVMKIGGEPHAPELLVVSVRLFLHRVAQEGSRDERLDPDNAIRLRIDRGLDAELSRVYCGSAKTYTALLPLVVSASGVMLTATAAIGPPPAVMAMYWRPLTE